MGGPMSPKPDINEGSPAVNHLPNNPRVQGSFSKYPCPQYGEVHDVFGGHISQLTRRLYALMCIFKTQFHEYPDKAAS
jgi:hypothetical protein